MEENLGAEVVEVAEQPTETDTGAEVVEVAEQPSEGVEEQEVADPAKHVKTEQDTLLAEQRRKFEAEQKKLREEMLAEIEAAKKNAADVSQKFNEFQQTANDEKEYARLKETAEQTGIPYENLVEAYEEKKATEETISQITSENEQLKAENEQLKAQLSETQQSAQTSSLMDEMRSEDEAFIRSIDPNMKLEQLDQKYFDLRWKMGYTPSEAYYASKGMTESIKPAPVIGKVKSDTPGVDFISEEAWDNMSKSDQDKLMKDNFDLVWSSQQKWFKK